MISNENEFRKDMLKIFCTVKKALGKNYEKLQISQVLKMWSHLRRVCLNISSMTKFSNNEY